MGAKGLDESIRAYSRGRSDGKAAKEADDADAAAANEDYDADTLDQGQQDHDDMEDQMDERPEDEEDRMQGEDFDDDMSGNYQGSPGAPNAQNTISQTAINYSLAPHEKDPRIYA